GGKDHGKGRDLFTQLSPITRYIFLEDDELLLKYLKDGGRSIGPAWFIPIIPMVLVNGSEGSGTGWSTFIPNYNPQDIICNLKHLLNGETMVPMRPWYKGFNGTIQKTASKDTQYTTTGIYKVIKDENALSITELPVRRWTKDYKEFLKAASQDGKDKTPFIETAQLRELEEAISLSSLSCFAQRRRTETKQQEIKAKKELEDKIDDMIRNWKIANEDESEDDSDSDEEEPEIAIAE
nr:DNA topoisomerase 2 [Tanacetum cinerariifolium]